MKIVNLDAPAHLADKVVELKIPNFIIEVVRHLERDCYDCHGPLAYYRQIIFGVHSSHNTALPLSPIWKFKEPEYENIATLIHTIPIYLRDSKPEEIRDENSIIDLLGAYYSNRKGDSPYIELFLSAIDNSSNNDENHFKWLFTKVLIHELAHAALDIFNLERNNSVIEKWLRWAVVCTLPLFLPAGTVQTLTGIGLSFLEQLLPQFFGQKIPVLYFDKVLSKQFDSSKMNRKLQSKFGL